MPASEEKVQLRERMVDCIRLLASAEDQLAYERAVPHVPVHVEIIAGFADDLYHPKSHEFIFAFSETELKDLARLYGFVCGASEGAEASKAHSVADALKCSEWRSMMTFAKSLLPNYAQVRTSH
jgi:hypothetical protein